MTDVRPYFGISDHVIAAVVAHFPGVTAGDITGPSRLRKHVVPRHLAMWILRQIAGHRDAYSYPRIGALFGRRDHTTVMHALEATDIRRATDGEFQALGNTLLLTLRAQLFPPALVPAEMTTAFPQEQTVAEDAAHCSEPAVGG